MDDSLSYLRNNFKYPSGKSWGVVGSIKWIENLLTNAQPFLESLHTKLSQFRVSHLSITIDTFKCHICHTWNCCSQVLHLTWVSFTIKKISYVKLWSVMLKCHLSPSLRKCPTIFPKDNGRQSSLLVSKTTLKALG